jgi:hypothetical protein
VQFVGDGDESAELLERECHALKVSIDAGIVLDRHELASIRSAASRGQ